MTIIEKILASHSGKSRVKPGDIVDVHIDVGWQGILEVQG